MAADMMKGKTVIVTGCSSGIGVETVNILAKKGARVIMAVRNEAKTEPIQQKIISETGNQEVLIMQLDLSSLDSVRAFANKFNANESRLDVLINNAGIWTKTRQETADGFEMMFGTNHLGHFLLTNLLLDKLKASAPSRIVNVSSSLHSKSIDFNDLQSETMKKFDNMLVYGRSKNANVLFSTHLVKILQGTGVTVYSVHPGVIKTHLLRDIMNPNNKCLWCFFSCLTCCIFRDPMKSVEEGSYTSIYCATDPSIAEDTGRYYKNSKESRAESHATDPERAEKLWNISKDLCKLDNAV